MSATDEWAKRLDKRYSQDERMLAYKFKVELDSRVNKFLDDVKTRSLLLGSFDLAKEPWRLAAANEFRKYQLKIIMRSCSTPNDRLTEIHLVKQRVQANK
jgi:hypothetical protein